MDGKYCIYGKKDVGREEAVEFNRGIEQALSRAEFIKSQSSISLIPNGQVLVYKSGRATLTHLSLVETPRNKIVLGRFPHTNIFLVSGEDQLAFDKAFETVKTYSNSHGYSPQEDIGRLLI